MKKGIAKQLIWISPTQKMRFYFMCWEYCDGQKVKETSPEQLFGYLSVCPHVRCCHSCANSGDIMDQSNEEQYSLSDLCCTNNSRSAHSYSWPCGHIAFAEKIKTILKKRDIFTLCAVFGWEISFFFLLHTSHSVVHHNVSLYKFQINIQNQKALLYLIWCVSCFTVCA